MPRSKKASNNSKSAAREAEHTRSTTENVESLQQQLAEKQEEIQKLKDENRKQIKQSEHAEHVQDVIFKITELSSGSEDIDQFYQALHRTISELLFAENFYIGLLSADRKSLELVYFVDSEDKYDNKKEGAYKISVDSGGLTSYLFNKGGSLLVAEPDIINLEKEGKIQRIGPGANSWLGATLNTQDKKIGVIVVQSYSQEIIYQPWHKELFEYVSNVIASTLERKTSRLQLEREVASRTIELSKEVELRKYRQETENALLRLSELANSTISLSNFYIELHQIITEFIYAENFYIVLKDPESERFSFVYYADTKDNKTLEELKQVPKEVLEQSLTGYLFKQGEALLVDNHQIVEMGNQKLANVQGPQAVSWLGIPLVLDGRVFGVMTLQSYDSDNQFTEKDKRLMEYAAKPVATAIQRKTSQQALENLVAKRTAELQETNNQLTKKILEQERAELLQSALYEISNLATGAEDTFTFYSRIHQILGELFDAKNFYIALLDEKVDGLKFTYIADQKDHKDPSKPSRALLGKNTISYRLVQTGKALLISGDEIEKLCTQEGIELVGSPFVSWLGAPLKDGSNSFGVMVVQSYQKDIVYTEWHKNLLSYVSNQVATTLLRKQAKENLEAKVKERTIALEQEIESRKKTEATQTVLYQIANLANQDLELDEFYKMLHQIIGSLIYCENFYIALKDEKSDQIRMTYFVDTEEEYDIESISALPLETLKKSITGYVMSKGTPLLANTKEISALAKQEGFALMGRETQSWMGIPLSIEGEVIGIMALQSYLPERIFNENEKELMIFVGQHVATALQRKRSKDYLTILVEQRTKELELSNKKLKLQISETESAKRLQTALYQITDLASSTENMGELYSSIHQIILQLIYAENFFIGLYDDARTQLELVYHVDIESDLENRSTNISTDSLSSTKTGEVLLNGGALLVTPDSTVRTKFLNSNFIGEDALYWLGVPLIIESNIIGLIAIQSYDSNHTIGNDEKELLEFVSQHIALTLERKQAQQALEKRVEERTAKLAESNASLEQQMLVRQRSEATQAALYYIANLANQNLPLESLFQKIHRAISKLVYSENFYIALWKPEVDDMEWVYFVDLDNDYDYSVVHELSDTERKKTFARYVVMNARPLLVNKQQALKMQEDKLIRFIGPIPQYYLAVPLIGNDGPIGVMAVQSYDVEISFSESDQELLNFVGQSVVSMIERRDYNINLEDKVKRRTQELQAEIAHRKESEELQKALFAISETHQSCATEKELYAKLHQIISQLMYAKSFYIALVDEEEQCFNFDYANDDVDKDIPLSIPIGTSLTSYVYRKKQTVHVNKKAISELEKSGEITHLGSYAIDWVGVPLMADNAIFGIMILQSYDESYTYGDREIGILNFVSTHIANALQRKKAEKELKIANTELAIKTQKAEEANKAKSAFLATVSHEIRTPMNGILGMLSLLSDTSLSSQQRDYVSKISTSSNSLLHIINDILDFSKIERGKLELEYREFDIVQMLDNIVDVFSSRLNEKRLEFNIEIDPLLSIKRYGDSLRLSQILVNLIGNAIKFTDRGYINVSIKQVGNNRLLFVVEDSGIGIEPEKREIIFSSFTQADDTTTRKFGGSGLGLSICQQLVQLMDGWIKVEGEIGKGSTFSFEVEMKMDSNYVIDNSEFVGANILLISDSERQIKSWKNLTAGFDIEFSSIDYDEFLENTNLVISEKISHVFLNEKNEKSNYSIIEQLLKRIQTRTSCFYLANPVPGLVGLPKIHDDVEIVDKPVKMGVILSLIKSDFDEIKEIRKHKKISSQARPKLIGKRVLLAEDNSINQQVATEILQKAGVKVDIASNGKEAVNACEEKSYDLILMDMQMPVMDGYQAATIIRQKGLLGDIPIIAMTANVMKGDKEKCLAHGMNDYIAKPIDRTVFFATIERVLNIESDPVSIGNSVEVSSQESDAQPEYEACRVFERLSHKFESEELATDLINMFVSNHCDDESKVRKLIAENRLDEAEKIIHKLKGSLGELTLSHLHFLAQGLDKTLKDEQLPTNDELEELFSQLRQAIDYLSKK